MRPRNVLLSTLLLLLCAACSSTTPPTLYEAPPAPVVVAPPIVSTPPAKTQPMSDRLRIAVVADLNGQYGSTIYDPSVHKGVRRIVGLAPDLVLSAGDMIGGQRESLDYRAMWSAFHDAVSDPFERAAIPFVVVPGNHDASAYSKFELERRLFIDEWTHRRPDVTFVDDSHYPLRHAFVKGPALFIALDATMSGPLSEAQRQWVESTLEAHDHYPIKIVYGHLPLYPFAQGHATNEVLADSALEQLLIDHRVDLFISGHHQAYFPGRRGPLRLVGTSSLAAGARKLLGSEERAAPSFVWIEIDAGEITSVNALPFPHFNVPVAREDLPFAVGHNGEWIVRDDLYQRTLANLSWLDGDLFQTAVDDARE